MATPLAVLQLARRYADGGSAPPLVDDITLAGGSITRDRRPSVGPLPPPSSGQQLATWLASRGWPRWQADRIGLAAGFTPMAAGYDAGQAAGRGDWPGAGLAAFGALPAARLPASLRATARHRFHDLNDAQLNDLSRWLTGSYHDLRRGVHGLPEDVAQSALRVWPDDFGLRLDNAIYGPGRYASHSRSRVEGDVGTPLGGTSAYRIRDIEDPQAVFEALDHARYASRDWLDADRLTLLGERSSSARMLDAGTDLGEFLFRHPLVIQQWRVGRSGADWRR